MSGRAKLRTLVGIILLGGVAFTATKYWSGSTADAETQQEETLAAARHGTRGAVELSRGLAEASSTPNARRTPDALAAKAEDATHGAGVVDDIGGGAAEAAHGTTHLDDVSRGTTHVDDLAKGTGHIDDLGRGASHIDDLGKSAGHLDDLGKGAGHLDDLGRGAGRAVHVAEDAAKFGGKTLKYIVGGIAALGAIVFKILKGKS